MYYLAPIATPQAMAAVADANGESPMKKHFKWKIQNSPGVPSMSSLTLPTITADDDYYMDPRNTMSPNLPGGAAGFMSPGMVHQAAAAAAAYGFAACNSGIVLERLGPHILRSHVSTAQYKPIPHNDGIDLEAFRRKDPREWNMDDVIGWMISVAKRRGIPVEDMNMHRFANCTGPLLTLMTQQNFVDRDSAYGGLLYVEFRKLMGDDGSSFLDDWLRLHKDDVTAGPSGIGSVPGGTTSASLLSSLAAATEAVAVAQGLYNRMTSMNTTEQPSTSRQHNGGLDDIFGRPSSFSQRESVIKAAAGSTFNGPPTPSLSSGAVGANLGSLPDLRKLKGEKIKNESGERQCEGSHYGFKFGESITSNGRVNSTSSIPKFPNGKIIKKKLNEGSCSITISGKPRKRSQHTRGNKLWEFIRTSLRDPRTCPTVVKWEDEGEGVFRIVESEKLARLWGEKKNNQKMTYEKLSRAMRTYYEKQILVPVPKTGLYPKKLVYKFGPNAKGWQLTSPTSIMMPAMKLSRNNNESDKTTKNMKSGNSSTSIPTAAATSGARFPFHPTSTTGILTLVSAAENGQQMDLISSSNILSKLNSAAVVAAANSLMSLADVASRQLATDEDDCKDAEIIDIDGHSDGDHITGAIEQTLEDGDDDDDDEEDFNEEIDDATLASMD